jgi:hypothetical protein
VVGRQGSTSAPTVVPGAATSPCTRYSPRSRIGTVMRLPTHRALAPQIVKVWVRISGQLLAGEIVKFVEVRAFHPYTSKRRVRSSPWIEKSTGLEIVPIIP